MSILLFIIVLAILVLVHEVGHFIAAKRAGVRVDEFGFGFPPRLWGKKVGETLYSINLIPLGGFVKIKGETGSEDRSDPESFVSKGFGRRMFILAAGVLMNILLAMIFFSIAYMIGVPKGLHNISSSAHIENRQVRVLEIMKESPNFGIDIKQGDIITRIDEQKVENITDFKSYVATRSGVDTVKLFIERGAEKKDVTAKIFSFNNNLVVGLSLVDTGVVSYGPVLAVYNGIKDTILYTGMTFKAFGSLIWNVLSGNGFPESLTGPVGLVVITGEAALYGLAYFISFIALLSVNLAVLNILPIPALDGGRILFVLIEMIRRKPNDEQVENIVHLTGYALLMILVIMVTFKDVGVYGAQIWNNFTRLF